MITPHPLFVPLHAHLCNASELAQADISANRLLSLYPLEASSYREFMLDFYRDSQQQVEHVGIEAISQKFADQLATIEDRVTLAAYEEEDYERYAELRYGGGGLTNQLSELTRELSAKNSTLEESTLYVQLRHLARTMLLLSHWPEADIEVALYATEADALHDFFVNFEKLLAYYGIKVRFDTSQRRESWRRWLVEHAEEDA